MEEMKANIVSPILWLILLTASASSFAAGATYCEIMTIEASNANGGTDIRIRKYENILKKQPFAKFNTFILVDRQTIEIDSPSVKSLTLLDSIGGSLLVKPKHKGQFQLTLTLSRAGQKPISIDGVASPGAPLFAAGLKSPNGVWIFGIACEDKNKITTY
jgi:hypothetical protein